MYPHVDSLALADVTIANDVDATLVPLPGHAQATVPTTVRGEGAGAGAGAGADVAAMPPDARPLPELRLTTKAEKQYKRAVAVQYAAPGRIWSSDLFLPGYRTILGVALRLQDRHRVAVGPKQDDDMAVGRGSWSEVVPGVYIDPETGRNHLVAIKILERTTNDDEGVYNFQRERDALAGRTVSRARKSRPMSESGRPATEVEGTFSHPCIVRYYGYALALW